MTQDNVYNHIHTDDMNLQGHTVCLAKKASRGSDTTLKNITWRGGLKPGQQNYKLRQSKLQRLDQKIHNIFLKITRLLWSNFYSWNRQKMTLAEYCLAPKTT
jgi:hypothetical protein